MRLSLPRGFDPLVPAFVEVSIPSRAPEAVRIPVTPQDWADGSIAVEDPALEWPNGEHDMRGGIVDELARFDLLAGDPPTLRLRCHWPIWQYGFSFLAE